MTASNTLAAMKPRDVTPCCGLVVITALACRPLGDEPSVAMYAGIEKRPTRVLAPIRLRVLRRPPATYKFAVDSRSRTYLLHRRQQMYDSAMAKIRPLLVVAVILSSPIQAIAEETGEMASTERAEKRAAVSAYILPGVIMPMGEISGELNLGSKMAALLAVGAGTADVDTRGATGDFSSESGLCLRFAGQFRYYLLGNFDRGLFGGAELGYFYVDRDVDNSVRTPNEGLWAGPAVGYKYTFGFGLLATIGVTVGFPLTRPDGLSEEEAPGSDAHDEKAGAGLSRDILFWPNLSVGWGF